MQQTPCPSNLSPRPPPLTLHAPDLSPVPTARLLAELDIPDCGCRLVEIPCGHEDDCDCPVLYGPPCRHIRALDHSLSLEEWGELLALVSPADYDPPPTPAAPSLALSREARIAIMEARHVVGLGLYHPGDLWRADEVEHVGKRVARIRNGRDAAEESLILDRAAA